MAHATNRTEMLAKALERAREDFSLHNARLFARAVIDAPPDVFGQKPLTFLPLDQSNWYRWRAAAEAAPRLDPMDQTPGWFAATGRYFKAKYGPDSSTWSPPEGLDPDGPTTALAAAIPEMLGGDFADAIARLRDAVRRWPEQCDLHRALFFTDARARELAPATPAQIDEMHSRLDTFGDLVAELDLGSDTFSMVWELPEVPLRLPLVTGADVRAAYVAHRFAAGDRNAAERALDWAIVADDDPDPSRAALSRRAATAVKSLIAFKNERWDELAGLAAGLSAPGADDGSDDARALATLGYALAALVLIEQGSSGSAMIAAAESPVYAGHSAVNAWLNLQLGLRARRDGDEESAQRHFGAGLRRMRLPALYEAAAATLQPSPGATARAERRDAAAQKPVSTSPVDAPEQAPRSAAGCAGIPIGGGSEPGVPVSPADARPGDIMVDNGRVLDPATGAVTALENTPAMAGPRDGFFRVAGSGADGVEAEALPGDLVLAAGTNEPIGAVIGGGMVSVPVEDDPRFREERCTLGSLLASGCGLRRIDIREVDPLVSFRPALARVVTVELLVALFGQPRVSTDARKLRRALDPRHRQTRGIATLHDLYEYLNGAGGEFLAAQLKFQVLNPVPAFTPLEDPVPVSPGPDRAENKCHPAKVAAALTALQPVPSPKFPQLAAESEDQIDIPALVREMGGAPHAGELIDRVVPASMMSRALVAAIGSGAVTLHADRTVTLPEPATEPTLDLPTSATRPHIERRDPGDAVQLWENTTFHVGVGTEGR